MENYVYLYVQPILTKLCIFNWYLLSYDKQHFMLGGITLKILLLGATGRVGQEVLKLALNDGHYVTAFVRDPKKLSEKNDNLSIFVGNALNKENILTAIPNHDIVISAMGTDGKETLSESMPYIIEAMENNKVKRIITVGTAGISKSRVSPPLYRYQSSETKRRSSRATRAAEDHRKAYELLANSRLNWTVVCPTYLPDGEKLGVYRYEKDYLPMDGLSISVSDTADFTYKQANSNEFIYSRVGLSY